MAQVHSVLVRAGREPCVVTGRPAATWLRPYVAGYSAFRAGAEAGGRRVLPLSLLGSRASELAGRLESAPGWAARFTVLDDLLTAWLRPERQPDTTTARGWLRLQDAGGRITISALASELAVGRRRLETGFGQEIGLTPKTVARIARFQDAVQVIAAPSGTFGAAAARGYADQPLPAGRQW